ncbi:MAG: HAD hydrolase-like protein, partial [Bacteroidaceae bacterium]|nr:HAD hydrolase-like protein [Bacteroidaceae bacterium]
MIKAVIFDLDGTLTDTLQDLGNSVNYALRRMEWPERSLSEVRQFVGNGVRRLVECAV